MKVYKIRNKKTGMYAIRASIMFPEWAKAGSVWLSTRYLMRKFENEILVEKEYEERNYKTDYKPEVLKDIEIVEYDLLEVCTTSLEDLGLK